MRRKAGCILGVLSERIQFLNIRIQIRFPACSRQVGRHGLCRALFTQKQEKAERDRSVFSCNSYSLFVGLADDSIGGQLFFALADAEFIRAVGIVTPDLSMFDDQMVHAASWDVYSKFLILFKGKCCNLLSVYGNMGGLSLGSRKKVLVSQKNRGRNEKDRC